MSHRVTFLVLLCAPWAVGHGVEAQALPVLQATRDLTVEGKAAHLDPSVRVRVGASGTIAIADPMGTRLMLVDRDMKRLQVLGSPGEGPGAINVVQFFGWIADSLWVVDGKLGRITIFTPGRAVARTMAIPLMVEGPPGTAVADHRTMPMIVNAIYPGGDLLVNEYFLNRMLNKDGGLSYLLRESAAGTYAGAMGPTISPTDACRLPDTTLTFYGWKEFCTGPQTQTSPDGRFAVTVRMVPSDSNRFMLTKVGERGDSVFHRSIPFVAIPVTPHELDSVVKRQVEIGHGASKPMNANGFRRLEEEIRTFSLPVHYPVLNPVLVGNDGTVWLSLSGAEPGKHWMEVDVRGNPVGQFTLPANIMLLQAEHGTAWGREILPDSSVNIVRYQIGPVARP